jgi:hypothetical protein
VTGTCPPDPVVGVSEWRLYRNTGSGFAAAATPWPLPSEHRRQFERASGQGRCGAAPDILHVLVDLTADGRPDLVVTDGCSVEPEVGASRWELFGNTGTGFAPAGLAWPLPTSFAGEFGLAADQGTCGVAPDVLHALVDLTGDGRPELVVTDGCSVRPTLGDSEWGVLSAHCQ